METQVQDRTMTQSLNASPYAEAAKLAAQRQMLEQDLAAQMPQPQPKEAKQEVAPQPQEMLQQVKPEETQANKPALMSPEELAQHKTSIQQLYAEKDQTLQQLQRNPKTTVKDGVLMGTGLGAAAAYGIKMVGDHETKAVNAIKAVLNKFVKDGKPDLTSAFKNIEHIEKTTGFNDVNKETIEQLFDNAQKYLTPQNLKATILGSFQGINEKNQKAVGNLAGELAKLIDPENGVAKDIPENLIKRLQDAGIKTEEGKAIADTLKEQLNEIASNVKEFRDSGIAGHVFDQKEKEVLGISETIAKIPGVKQEFVQKVFDNVAGNTQNAQGATDRVAQIGTIAAIVGTTVAVCAVANWALNHGKSEKHDKLKSHVDRLDEKILQEQQALKAGLGI